MSDLDQYLEGLTQGERSSGEFKLDPVAALAKISAHQLPTRGSWALKVVQAAVAEGSCEAIHVSQTRSGTRFVLSSMKGWSREQLQKEFWTVEPSDDSAFNHLKAALWNVGVHQKRPFTISLPDSSETLEWDGEAFHDTPSGVIPEDFELWFEHQPRGSTDGWWARLKHARKENASVSKNLVEFAFVCPVPLTIDSRRIDFLMDCSHPGLGAWSYPVAFTFLEQGEPVFPLPGGAFKPRNWLDRNLSFNKGLKAVSHEALNELQLPAKNVWLATVLSVHLGYHTVNKSQHLKCRYGRSRCNWVMDGVVVQRHTFFDRSTSVSLACFLSGQGLQTDMTTLGLQQTPELKRRYGAAVRALHEVLSQEWEFSLSELAEHEERRHKTEAGVLGVASTVLMVLPPLGLLLLWATRRGYQDSQEKSRSSMQEALNGLETLRQEWSTITQTWSS